MSIVQATRLLALLLAGAVLANCNRTAAPGAGAEIDGKVIADESDGRNWASYGRTYSEQHASPLDEINTTTIGRLGLAWSMELPNLHSAATVPLAVDGVLYFGVDQAMVYAVDAATGRLLWSYRPKLELADDNVKGRTFWGTRGIAFWKGKVYVGAPDGRLIAIDAKSGQPVWTVQTTDPRDARFISGAPRVFKGLVLIGHGGADTGANRGYVTAYDAETGAQRWRFFTVPGDPSKGFEDDAQAMAAKTWFGAWWKYGGGGTAWNALTYDPELDTVYIGVGNGSPWNIKIRSEGKGDNLFLSAIVALDAATGKYKWHYQVNPGESWDYSAAMDMVLATLNIDGKPRKVLMQAPKNGFFYVIDRETGKLISAEKFAPATWAEKIDLVTGRPVEAPGIRYPGGEVSFKPSSAGAHSWQPMAYNPATGLMYIPTIDVPGIWSDKGIDRKTWMPERGQGSSGLTVSATYDDYPPNAGTSALIAYNPITQKEAWKVATPGIWNGGVLTTAGGLVFQGRGTGLLKAYAADSGKSLWSFDAKMGIVGAPITYQVEGRQYVTVLAGWGASGAGYLGSMGAQYGWVSRKHNQRVVTFVLDGKAALPTDIPPREIVKPIDDPSFKIDPTLAKQGQPAFMNACLSCHGSGAVSAGYAPDLRASSIPLDAEAFKEVVVGGSLVSRGMPQFSEFTDTQLLEIRHYLRLRARDALSKPPLPLVQEEPEHNEIN